MIIEQLLCKTCDSALLPHWGPYGDEKLWQCISCETVQEIEEGQLELWEYLFITGSFSCPLCDGKLERKQVRYHKNVLTLHCTSKGCKWWTWFFGSQYEKGINANDSISTQRLKRFSRFY